MLFRRASASAKIVPTAGGHETFLDVPSGEEKIPKSLPGAHDHLYAIT
jgi:hypothetical protein